jgi:uncharacterized membrane protein YcaP (DUF421 family)
MGEIDFLSQLVGETENVNWWQMCVRATLILVFGIALVRAAVKRVFGQWGAIDIILSVIIGSNLSRALTGTVPLWETLIATTLLVALHAVLVSLAVRLRWLGPTLKGNAARIVLNGEPDDKAMRRHGVGEGDLEEALREGGVLDCKEVREAWVERNGKISVIKR